MPLVKMECIRWFLCVTGMSLVSTYDDLSYQKYATQSTTYTGPYNSSKAGNAVDGDLTTCTRTKAIGVTSQDKRVTWQVDLGDVYSIHSINIVFRNYDGFEMRQRGRFAGFSLYISNTGIMDQGSLVYKDGPLLPPLNFTTTCFTFGRYVIFYNDRLDVDNYPSGYEDPVYTELCEVTVLGCQSGVYGNNCDAPCPTTCGERFCHTQNGTCFSCNPGTYGRNCEDTCPTNCKEHFCKMPDGSCLTCKPGWTGLFCNTKCMEGWYGENCKSKCPGQCQQNATCNHVTGWCDVGCAVGWTGLFCNIEKIDISRNKYATQSNTAVGTTYSAHNALDRDVTTCTRTKDIGLNSSNKEVWWKVDLGKRYAIQGVSIMFKNYEGKEMRQRGRLAGFSIYLSTTGVINDSFVCYKDGPLLHVPSLNFTTDCIGSGRYVIFFNERLSGISYPEGYETTSVTTELCEVIVQGCENPGVYGRDCDDPCPQNCEDSRCHLLNGTCLSCKPGFMGTLCTTKCKPGWYGDGCNKQCSRNCKIAPCNDVTGHCDGGCTSGWNGTFCLEECFKSFGENCQNPCSQHCYDQECNIHNGSCLTGCTDNFYGTQCDKDILSKPDRSPASCEEATTLWFYCGTISLAVNLMFIAGVCVYIWRVYSIKPALSCKLWRCAESSLYTEPGASSEEDSLYLTVFEQRKPKNV